MPKRRLLRRRLESPEAYVKENGRYPVIDHVQMSNGDTQIITGDGAGSMVRYTFTEF